MKTFATTLGIAATVGFAALGLATTASASPTQTDLSAGNLTSVHGGFARGNASDTRSDHFRECMERARIAGVSGMALIDATVAGCQVTELPATTDIGQ